MNIRNRIRNFYIRHLWCFGFRLSCVRRFAAAVWYWDTCDYAPTLRMMEIAFRSISESHASYPIVADAEKVARQTLIVAELCRRLGTDDYHDLAGYARYDQMTERQKRHWAKHTNYLAEQDVAYLQKMLKHLRKWWH